MKRKEHESAIIKLETRNWVRSALEGKNILKLEVVKMLSAKGQFGPLFLVRNEEDFFVLKAIEKSELELYDVCKFAIDEGNTLEQVSCPFIVSMGKKFQSHNYIYYLHEQVKGRDLYDILKTIGLLSTEDSQFYTASIILIL